MTGDPTTDAALSLVARESAAFVADIDGFTPDDWGRLTSCEPWTVRVLVAHLTRGAEAYIASIQSGLRGQLGPWNTREERERRTKEIESLDSGAIVALFRANVGRFADVFSALGADEIETLGLHSFGPRSARWFVDQRLAEVAFHRWDLEHSIGRTADLERETAEHVLPMLYEENLAPTFERNKPSGEGRYRVIERGGGGHAWTVLASNGFVGVSQRSAAPVDATIEGDAAALCLLMYGRRGVTELEGEGRLSVKGDHAVAERFDQIFRGP